MGVLYARVGGVWEAVTTGGGISQADADGRYVNIDGDTMTGALTVDAAGGVVRIKRPAGTAAAADDPYIVAYAADGTTRKGFIQWRDAAMATPGLRLNVDGSLPIRFFTAGLDRLVLDADGTLNTGMIQATGPVEALRLARVGSTSPHLGFYNETFTTRYGYIMGDSSYLRLAHATGGCLLYGGGTVTATVHATGMHVGGQPGGGQAGVELFAEGAMTVRRAASGGALIQGFRGVGGTGAVGDSYYRMLQYGTPDVQAGNITLQAGPAVTYGTSSDYRMKNEHGPVTDALARLGALRPIRFAWKAAPDVEQDGFLAHEVAEVVPNAVVGDKDAVDDDGNIETQQFDPGKLVPLLTAALQEATARIEALEARLAALETT